MRKTESAKKSASVRGARKVDADKSTKKKAAPAVKAPKPRTKEAVVAATPASSTGTQESFLATGSDKVARQGIRLSFLVHDVSRMRRAAYDQIMRPLNITRARWWVLAHLSRHDGMMQSQLADVLEVGKASLGTVIEQLELSGWVERRADPTDKRAKRVFLSRTALPLMKRMILEEEQFNNRVLSKLSIDDRDTLIRLLSLVKEELVQLVPGKVGDSDED